jgi:hypothetical protein
MYFQYGMQTIASIAGEEDSPEVPSTAKGTFPNPE